MPCVVLHGDIAQAARDRGLQQFRDGKYQVCAPSLLPSLPYFPARFPLAPSLLFRPVSPFHFLNHR